MAKTRLLQAVCTVAMLAAVPAFAQPQRPGSGLESPNGTLNPTVKQPTSGPLAPANNGANTSSMAPASTAMTPSTNSGSGSSTTAQAPEAHHAMMSKSTHAVGSKSDTSQDAAVNRLNDESYQAAEKGQMFSAAGSTGMSSGSSTRGSSSSRTAAPSLPPSGAMTNPTK